MSMVSITTSQIPPEFCFPLRPQDQQTAGSPRRTGSFNHSRTYTGIQIPFPVKPADISPAPAIIFPDGGTKDNISHAASTGTGTDTEAVGDNINALTTNPAPPPQQQPSRAKPPHRRHQHRRSAAISHDFSIADTGLGLSSTPSSKDAVVSSPSSPSPALDTVNQNLNQNFNSRSRDRHSLDTQYLSPDDALGNNAPFSSSSSLPLQSSASFSSWENSEAPESKQRKPRVQFASEVTEIDRILDVPTLPVTPTSSIHQSPPPSLSTPAAPATPPHTPPKKHRKVKSWAGSFIKFRSSKKDNKSNEHKKGSAVETASTRKSEESVSSLPAREEHSCSPPEFHSSSYVSTVDISDSALLSLAITHEPEVPLIDLDAALGPFRTPKLAGSFRVPQFEHRRTESAPEAVFEQHGRPRFDRSMKRRVNSVAIETEDTIMEEEEDYSPVMYEQPKALLSSASLVSTNSATSNRDRARLARSSNSLAIPLPFTKSPHLVEVEKRPSSLTNEPSITPTVVLEAPPPARISTESDTSSMPESHSEIFEFGEPGPEIRKSQDYPRPIPRSQSHPATLSIAHHPQPISPPDAVQRKPSTMSIGQQQPAPTPRPRKQQQSSSSSSRHHTNRFSISSLASLGLSSLSSHKSESTGAPRRSVPRRVWGWVRGKRVSRPPPVVESNEPKP